MGATVSKLKRRLSAADISETPRSRRLAVAMTVKPGCGVRPSRRRPGQVRDADRRSERIDTSASCTSGRQRVISSTRATAPGAHRGQDRRRHQRLGVRALGEQQGVVPAVAQLVLGGAGGALHGQRAGAADGGGQQLGEHRLGGAGLADEQQAALAGQGDHAAFDQRAFADELRHDPHGPEDVGVGANIATELEVFVARAGDKRDGGTRCEAPARRPARQRPRPKESAARRRRRSQQAAAGRRSSCASDRWHRLEHGPGPARTRCQAVANSSCNGRSGSTRSAIGACS